MEVGFIVGVEVVFVAEKADEGYGVFRRVSTFPDASNRRIAIEPTLDQFVGAAMRDGAIMLHKSLRPVLIEKLA